MDEFFAWFLDQIFRPTVRQTLNFRMATILTIVPPGKQKLSKNEKRKKE